MKPEPTPFAEPARPEPSGSPSIKANNYEHGKQHGGYDHGYSNQVRGGVARPGAGRGGAELRREHAGRATRAHAYAHASSLTRLSPRSRPSLSLRRTTQQYDNKWDNKWDSRYDGYDRYDRYDGKYDGHDGKYDGHHGGKYDGHHGGKYDSKVRTARRAWRRLPRA